MLDEGGDDSLSDEVRGFHCILRKCIQIKWLGYSCLLHGDVHKKSILFELML